MTAKEYLSQARSLKTRIATMREQLEFLESAASYTSSQFSDMPKAPRNICKSEDAYIRCVEKQEQIKAAEVKLSEVVAMIDRVSDPDQQAVIVKRYLGNKTWAEIAAEIYVSHRRVYDIHLAALETVGALLEDGHGSA